MLGNWVDINIILFKEITGEKAGLGDDEFRCSNLEYDVSERHTDIHGGRRLSFLSKCKWCDLDIALQLY